MSSEQPRLKSSRGAEVSVRAPGDRPTFNCHSSHEGHRTGTCLKYSSGVMGQEVTVQADGITLYSLLTHDKHQYNILAIHINMN